MKIELLKAVDQELEMYPEAFGGAVTSEEVTQAEAKLKVKLPEDFKNFFEVWFGGNWWSGCFRVKRGRVCVYTVICR